jgi:hypothetical protein
LRLKIENSKNKEKIKKEIFGEEVMNCEKDLDISIFNSVLT